VSSRRDAAPTIDTPLETPSSGSSEFLLLDDQKISEEDRKEILDSIEKVAAENRLSASDALFKIKPLKHGFVFPLIINVLAAIAVAAGFVGSNIYFSRQQAVISSRAGTFFSAEGKLIAQVQKESAAKLKAKDQEISSVKAKLTQLDQESAALRNNMEATISAKEAQLKTQMQAQLEAEKTRLQKLGISQTEIDSRLKAFELQKNSEFAAQLDQYKQQSEATLKAKEQQIQAQQEQSRQALAQANKERQQLLDQAQQQESKLRAQFQAQTQQLQSANEQLKAQTTAAEQKLQALSTQSQNEQLISDQIVGSYNAILQNIQQAQYEQANKDIASLENLLNSLNINALPSLAKRRPVDLELVQSLKELIAARTKPGQPAVDPAVVQRSNEVRAAQRLVDQAQAAEKNGDLSGANDLYSKAISQIPIIDTAYKALASVFDRQRGALQQESDAKTAQIGQLTKTLNDTQASLKTAENNIADLKKQIADQNDRIASLNQLVASGGGASSGLQKQVSDQNKQLADLTAKLDEANTAVSDLKKKLAESDSHTADLQKQLAAAKASEGGSQQQPSAQSASAEAYKKELDTANATNADLKQQLADNEAQIGKLKTDLAAAQTKIHSLQTNVTQVLGTFSSVQAEYANYRGQLMSLISSGTPQDIQKARELFLQFIGRSGVNQVLPGFTGVAEQVTNASAKVAEEQGAKSGRESALTDVMKVTNYYSTPVDSSAAAGDRQTINQKAAQDPLFRQTASDIQKLAEKSGQAAGRQALSVQYQLIGTISYVSSNAVTVEKLVNVPVAQGSTVLIRHKNGDGAEVPIAEGKVTGLSTDSVEVTVQSLLHGSTSPQLLDIVYLQQRSGA